MKTLPAFTQLMVWLGLLGASTIAYAQITAPVVPAVSITVNGSPVSGVIAPLRSTSNPPCPVNTSGDPNLDYTDCFTIFDGTHLSYTTAPPHPITIAPLDPTQPVLLIGDQLNSGLSTLSLTNLVVTPDSTDPPTDSSPVDLVITFENKLYRFNTPDPLGGTSTHAYQIMEAGFITPGTTQTTLTLTGKGALVDMDFTTPCDVTVTPNICTPIYRDIGTVTGSNFATQSTFFSFVLQSPITDTCVRSPVEVSYCGNALRDIWTVHFVGPETIQLTSSLDTGLAFGVTATEAQANVQKFITARLALSKPQGNPLAWGNDSEGQLGNGSFSTSPTPTAVRNLARVGALSGGIVHSLALTADGTTWAWGANGRGQLGNGTLADSNVPVSVSGLTPVGAVAAGGAHSLVVQRDGTVWAWGDNSSGQLGLGTIGGAQRTPVQVPALTDVKTVAAGTGHSVALKRDGTVYTWGNNLVGELGTGTVGTANPTPTVVPGLSGVVAIASLGAHTLALKSDGTVWAWGDNHEGQLGIGTMGGTSPQPVQVTGLTAVRQIAAGGLHSVALKGDGTVVAWGWNFFGQLGNGSRDSSAVPVPVSGLTGVFGIAAGGLHSLALEAGGTGSAWGANFTGQLGTGTFEWARPLPAPVTGLKSALFIAGGGAHTLAVVQ